MVDKVVVLVEETSVSTGTGNFTLTSKLSRRTFNTGYGIGGADKFYYFILNRSVDEYEFGTGHLLNATTLVRDTVIKSSDVDAFVSFSSGTKDIISDFFVPAGTVDQIYTNNGAVDEATFKTLTHSSFISEVFTDPAGFVAGTDNSITLAASPINEQALFISFNGVNQHTTQFSLAGSVVTFTLTIPIGVTEIEVRIHVPGTIG